MKHCWHRAIWRNLSGCDPALPAEMNPTYPDQTVDRNTFKDYFFYRKRKNSLRFEV
jgi:hypothetical protein